MVINVTDLKATVGRVLEGFDHKHLNEDTEHFRNRQPTTENIVGVLWELIVPELPAGVSSTACASTRPPTSSPTTTAGTRPASPGVTGSRPRTASTAPGWTRPRTRPSSASATTSPATATTTGWR